jgi:FixJ family two-component response regulator
VPERPLIAIVDDDPSFRCALGNLVRSLGYGTREYGSGEDFLVGRDEPDAACVIVDVHMPAMSGLELLDRLVLDPQAIPVIMITAEHRDEAREAVLRRGAVEYLPKPIPEDRLMTCLSELCG